MGGIKHRTSGGFVDLASLKAEKGAADPIAVGASARRGAEWVPLAAGGGVKPDEIADLRGWWEADGITGLSDGDLIDPWPDSSGNSNDAVKPAVGGLPTYKTGILNGLPIARFDGGDHLALPDSTLPTGDGQYTIFAVAFWTADDLRPVIGAGSTASAHQQLFLRAKTTWQLNDGWHSNNLDSGNNILEISTWHQVSTRYDGTGRVMRIDGIEIASDSATNRSTDTTDHTLGADGGGDNRMAGDIAEVIVYDRSLNSQEVSDIESYLTSKYAL